MIQFQANEMIIRILIFLIIRILISTKTMNQVLLKLPSHKTSVAHVRP